MIRITSTLSAHKKKLSKPKNDTAIFRLIPNYTNYKKLHFPTNTRVELL